VLVENKSCYSGKWKKGDKWNISRSIEKEPWPWGLVDTWQVKPWKVVEGNREADQTTTLATHEITHSRGTNFEGIGDGEGNCKDGEEGRAKTLSGDYHEGWCKKSTLGTRKSNCLKMNSSTYMKNWRGWRRFCNHYNKRCPHMPSDFTRFWVNSLV